MTSAGPAARRLGIRAKIWIAFLSVSAMTVLATVIAWHAFSEVSDTLDEIAADRVPAIVDMSRLAQETNALLVVAPQVLFADTQTELDAQATQVARAEAAFGDALRRVQRRYGYDPDLVEMFEIAGRINASLQILIGAIRHRLELSQQFGDLNEQVAVLQQEFRLLLTDTRSVGAPELRVLAEINLILGRLHESSQSQSVEVLQRHRTIVDQHVALLREAVPTLAPGVGGDALRLFALRLARIAGDHGNIIETRRRELWTRDIANQRLIDIKTQASELDALVSRRLTREQGAVNESRRLTESRKVETLRMLAAFSIIALAGGLLVAWLYVGRNILGRLHALKQSMNAIAAGNLRAPIPIDDRNHDEVTEMTQSLLVFREAVANVASANSEAEEARSRLQTAIETVSEGFALFDRREQLLLFNDKFANFLPLAEEAARLGWTLTALVTRSFKNGDIQPRADTTALDLEQWRDSGYAFEIKLASGSWLVVNARAMPGGGTVLILTDITTLKRREEETRRTSDVLEHTFEAIGQGLAVFNDRFELEHANRNYQRMFDLPSALFRPGTPVIRILDHLATRGMRLRDGLGDRRRQMSEGGYALEDEARLWDGRVVDIRRNAMPEGGFVATYTDVTTERSAQERIGYLATHDALTGLGNGLMLEQSVTSMAAEGRRGALIYFNLMGFKEINRTFGRQTGDEALRTIARRLDDALLPDEVAVRLGADDFAVVQTNAPEPSLILDRAYALRDIIERAMDINGLVIDVSPCIGIARVPKDATRAAELIQCGEMAMNRARDEHGAAIQFYDESLGKAAVRQRFLRQELRQAIARDELRPYYQAKIDIETGTVVGMEALVRWCHGEEGMISPADFVPVAEASGLILPIGERVLRVACADAAAWNKPKGIGPLRLAVNVSPVQLLGQDMVAKVEEVLRETDLDPDRLELEITEGIAMQDDTKVMNRLRDLRTLGVQIAIDDFGTGYSSLSYLKRLPVTTLKIDQVFVRNLDTDEEDARLCRAIIGIAQDFGLKTVAEGVETEAHLAFLREEGCEIAQGYLFARAEDAEAFEAYVRAARMPQALPNTA